MEKNNKKEGILHKTGDAIERAGEKIKGTAPGLGRAIYNTGNKIEHAGEKKNLQDK